jgi:hypothetical protein
LQVDVTQLRRAAHEAWLLELGNCRSHGMTEPRHRDRTAAEKSMTIDEINPRGFKPPGGRKSRRP